MAIQSIKIANVMAFQQPQPEGEPFHLAFSPGINVLIGENGMGKTTLLKMIYAAAQCSAEKAGARDPERLLKLFSSQSNDAAFLRNPRHPDAPSYYEVSQGTAFFRENFSPQWSREVHQWQDQAIPPVFIPTTEMLSHAKGFLALNQKYHIPFDDTQVDIIVNASLPETREVSPAMKGILDKISPVIDGKVVQEDDAFYVIKSDGRKLEFSLEAEGLRKLGLLWKLIRNGLLEPGTVLLWDEPEANLNPELFPLVADILVGLEAEGVQIFAATHSYNFAKYLEIRRRNKAQVQFHNLYREPVPAGAPAAPGPDPDHPGAVIRSASADTLEGLMPNPIMDADLKLLDEVYAL